MIDKVFYFVRKALDAIYIKNNYIPADKQRHLISGAVGGALFYLFIGAYSVAVIAIIAAAKEVNDYFNKDKHTPDVVDWAATTLGGIVGVFLVYLIK